MFISEYIDRNGNKHSIGNNAFANAIKATASGTAIRLQEDLSPVEHNLKVKLSAGNSLFAFGKNLCPRLPYPSTAGFGITVVRNEDGSLTFNGTSTGTFSFIIQFPFIYPKGNYVMTLNSSGEINVPTGASANYYVRNEVLNWMGVRNLTDANTTIVIPDTHPSWANGGLKDMMVAIYTGVTLNNFTIKLQLEIGTTATEYEPYIEPQIYPVNADGTVDGVVSLSPVTSLFTDTTDAQITVEYNRDANSIINNLIERVAALEANALNN